MAGKFVYAMNNAGQVHGPGSRIINYAPVTYTYKFTIGNDGNIAYGYKEPNAYDGEPGYGSGPAGDANKKFGLLLFRVLNFNDITQNRWDRVAIGFSSFYDKFQPTDLVKECKITFFGKRSLTLAVNAKANGDDKWRMLFARDDIDLLTSYIVDNEGKEVEMTVTFVNATEVKPNEIPAPPRAEKEVEPKAETPKKSKKKKQTKED